jgi:hypothetical protein
VVTQVAVQRIESDKCTDNPAFKQPIPPPLKGTKRLTYLRRGRHHLRAVAWDISAQRIFLTNAQRVGLISVFVEAKRLILKENTT